MVKELSNIRKGVVGELIIQIELLKKGWSIYKNLCDDNGIDFLIKKGNKIYSIQVKYSTSLNKYNQAMFGLGKSKKRPDYFIAVYRNIVWIIPEHQIKSTAFQLSTNPNLSKFDKYRNDWSILED